MTIHPTTCTHDYMHKYPFPDDVMGIYGQSDELPDGYYNKIKTEFESDYAAPMLRGKEWLFEFTCNYQPRTGAMLMEGGSLTLLLLKKGSGVLALDVNGKMVRLYRSFYGEHFGEDSWNCERKVGFEKSLPCGLGDAYYSRFHGMSLVCEHAPSIHSHALPKYIGSWELIDQYLSRYRFKKKYLPWFNERFPEIFDASQDDQYGVPYHRFRCWLDTSLVFPIRDLTAAEQRSQDRNDPVDALFVRQDIAESPIYHVVDGKLDEMRVLNNPAEAVDLYCEHVLLGREERFDFIEHGQPLD